MRILYISQYFPPESGATQTRAFEMARNWVQLGHDVTMLTEMPNHPGGVIFPGYRGKLVQRDVLEGIDVIRVWVKASPTKNFRNRMLFYLSFMINSTLAGMLYARGKFDLLYVTSPPLFVGGVGLALSRIRRIPMVFEVRDLWPESAVALGEISSRKAIEWATRLEEACYRRAQLIIVVTRGIQKRLIERGIEQAIEKLRFVPNGANVDLFQFLPDGRERIRQEYRLGDKFVVVYAGIHGVAQGLESVVEAAQILVNRKDIHFLFIGDGPRKNAVNEMVDRFGLTNVTMLPHQPRERMPGLLSASDVALIPLRDLDLFRSAIPSKMFDAWACQRPLLLSIEGEAHKIMDDAGGGQFVRPEDPTAMAEAIMGLYENPHQRLQMGFNGRQFTVSYFSRRALAEELISLLEENRTKKIPPGKNR